jgi:hypothetical protein
MATDRWSLRNIYLYLVCLITLIMVITGTVGVIRSGVELLYPDPSGEMYMEKPMIEDGQDGMTQEEWDRQIELQKASSRRWAVLELVGMGALVLIAGPLYVYHWRKIEVEHGDKPAAA